MLLKAVYFFIGFLSGYQIGPLFYTSDVLHIFNWDLTGNWAQIAIKGIFGFIFGLIFVIIIPIFARGFEKISKKWVKELKSVSLMQLVMYVVTLIISLILAALVCNPIYKLEIAPFLQTIITIVIYVGLGYLALLIVSLKYADVESMFKNLFNRESREEPKVKTGKKNNPIVVPKILDTSVIIDGRIFDILKTGFVEGPIVIPTFVLDELQFIADSSDGLKRNRGRRGLDILNKIQKELPVEVQISEKNYNDISEVDSKLLRLARDLKGKVVTNDYNLNKIAEFHGVDVLNTNDLSNAVKSVVLPGEEMPAQVIKEGKESNQGVAYLDDGTMIVVEGGRNLIGKTINVVVTSVLQTSAGRMIFAKPIS